MKTRILEWLKEFSEDEALDNNEKASDILTHAKCTPKELQRRASKMHEHILHHYSDFAVQTIDSFVHKIIKSFSRDLKLSTDFEVEMDTEKVITELVADQLRDTGKYPELTATLFDFLKHRLDEEKSTYLRTSLISFYKSNSDEVAQKNLEAINAKTFSDYAEVQKELNAVQSKLIKRAKALQEQMQRDISLVQDAVFHHLKNWINKEFYSFLDYPKTASDRRASGDIFKAKVLEKGGEYEVVNSLVLTALDELIPLLDELKIIRGIGAKCYQLALVTDYKERLEQYKEDNNVLLISDFTQIISDVVKDNPAPFIYERLGERYKYYLIDEFQDTSISQWHNFLPLITHTLAKGQMTMLVGDSKQAIYRWRNGDFELFSSLPSMKYDEDDFILKEAEQQLKSASEIKELSTNYRSSAEVVEFNNLLFEGYYDYLPPLGHSMYKGVRQTPNIQKEDGYVELTQYTTEDDETPDLDKLLEIIRDAEARDFDKGDIVILARKKNRLAEIATFLDSQGIKTSSAEGLFLSQSVKVRLLLAMLRYSTEQEDNVINTEVLSALEALDDEGNSDLLAHDVLRLKSVSEDKKEKQVVIENYLKVKCGEKPPLHRWKQLSALEIIYEILAYLGLDKGVDGYVETFLDFAFSAGKRGVSTVRQFLEYWEENDDVSLSTPEDKNSVKLMTVHKSKGLEFPVVIHAQPFSKGRSSELWYNLDALDLPLNRTMHSSGGFFQDHQGQALKYEGLKKASDREKEEAYLDDLNVLYVALTRASQELYMLLDSKCKERIYKDFLEIIQTSFSHELTDEKPFSFGKKSTKRKKDQLESAELEELMPATEVHDWRNRLVFKFSKKDTLDLPFGLAERVSGIEVHAFLAEIKFEKDWNSRVKKAALELDDEPLVVSLKQLATQELWNEWFTEPKVVYNEKRLIDSEGNEFIPDRVMLFENEVVVVDYKTGETSLHHSEQVKNYMNLLSEMTGLPPKGYLVYLREGEIVEVTL